MAKVVSNSPSRDMSRGNPIVWDSMVNETLTLYSDY